MFRRAPFLLLGVFFLWSGSITSAHEADEAWIRGVFTGKSPRVVTLAETDAWQRACACAEHAPNSFVLVGSGESMQPLYPPGTILVLQKFPYEFLERGQTVLYRNQANKVVAHVLVAKARDGWRVAGLNNRRHDLEPVQAGNLVGVVIAAFQPVPVARVQIATLSH
jgi:hypothetical protein